jgi:hypothetical protein
MAVMPLYYFDGGLIKQSTVDVEATDLSLAAHLAETDPFVHSAAAISEASTVGAGNVEDALSALDADKASSSAVDTALALKADQSELDALDTLVKMVSSAVSTTNINNTTSESDLISFTLPANTLGGNGDLLVVESGGDILANSGSPTFTWKVKSGTIVLATPAAAMTISANQRRWKLRVVIHRTAVGAQTIEATLTISQAIATTQFNLIDTAHTWVGHVSDIAATNFGVDSTIAFTITMSVANANNRVRRYGYSAHKIAAA